MNGCRLQNWEQPRPSVTDGRGCSYRGKKTGDCRLIAAGNRLHRAARISDRIPPFLPRPASAGAGPALLLPDRIDLAEQCVEGRGVPGGTADKKAVHILEACLLYTSDAADE